MYTKNKMEVTKKDIKDRQKFLDTYRDFQNYLGELGFVSYVGYESTPEDYYYSWYDTKINSLYSVERYVNEDLKIDIRFLRDKYEHKFLTLGGEVYPLKNFKENIKNWVKEEVAQRQLILNKYKNL